jgi:hypothetical protein
MHAMLSQVTSDNILYFGKLYTIVASPGFEIEPCRSLIAGPCETSPTTLSKHVSMILAYPVSSTVSLIEFALFDKLLRFLLLKPEYGTLPLEA